MSEPFHAKPQSFMERNPALREMIAASRITPEEIEEAISATRAIYKRLDKELPDGHNWKYKKLLHAETCAEEVAEHAPLFGFRGVETDVFRFILFGHDIGRLEQGIRRERGETVDDEVHGKLSVEHIVKAIGLRTSGSIWPFILKAIECHSLRVTPKAEDLGGLSPAHPLIQVMRDTDKLGGFDAATSYTSDPERKDKERRANWKDFLDADPLQGTEMGIIAPACFFWSNFLSSQALDRRECRSYEAYMLQLLAWMFDVQTPEMRRVIIDRGGPKIVFDYLIKRLDTGSEKLETRADRIEASAQLLALQKWGAKWEGGILLG